MGATAWLVLVASIHAIHSNPTCQRFSLLPPADLKSSCEAFSKHRIVTLEARVQELVREVATLREQNASCEPPANTPATFSVSYRDCQDVATYNVGSSGVYNITTISQTKQLLSVHRGGDTGPDDHYLVIDSSGTTPVYCDIDDGVGWTVIMRRSSLQDDFNRTWEEYQNGFGQSHGDFWMGLENLHRITTQPFSTFSLWITIIDSKGVPSVFPYSSFKVLDSSTLYKLQVSGYFGRITDPFTVSNNRPFQRWRRLRSSGYSSYNKIPRSASGHIGGGYWWFREANGGLLCGANSLNSIVPYWSGISTQSAPIKSVEMKIKLN